jgi:hypothetical protein
MSEKVDQKISVLFTADEFAAIEDVWHEDRFRSRNEAIRALVKLGMEARAATKRKKGGHQAT